MSVRGLAARVALIRGSLGLFIVVMLGRDLFLAIPWPIRKAGGWLLAAGVAAALARRLMTIRPGDGPPLRGPVGGGGRGRFDRWVIPLVLAGVISSLAWPLLSHPGRLAFGDWEYFTAKYEAGRRSIVDYGQFPWWDPWTRGGFPLAANPLYGVFGVAMPLVLRFGTTAGLGL